MPASRFSRDRLSTISPPGPHAKVVTQYDANNTYQYIINRDEVQLTWLAKAIADEGGSVPESVAAQDTPTSAKRGDVRNLFDADGKESQAFIDRWRDKVEHMEHARHKAMLRVILGETREQQRFFEQALAGRTDLLGRRGTAAGPAQGEVLPARWIE